MELARAETKAPPQDLSMRREMNAAPVSSSESFLRELLCPKRLLKIDSTLLFEQEHRQSRGDKAERILLSIRNGGNIKKKTFSSL